MRCSTPDTLDKEKNDKELRVLENGNKIIMKMKRLNEHLFMQKILRQVDDIIGTHYKKSTTFGKIDQK